MRVLTIGNLYPPAGGGGYERIWVAGVRALRAAGHEVGVLTTDAEVPAGEDPGDAVRALRWYWEAGEWKQASCREARAVERHNADVLDRQLEGVDAVVWWAMGGMTLSLVERVAQRAIPAVGIVGDGWMLYGPEHDPNGQRVQLRDAARWIFISRYTAERSGFPDGEVLHPGVDPARFAPAAPLPWRGRLAYVGRVAEGKGVETLRAAVELLGDAELAISEPGSGDPAAAYADADAVVFPVQWPEPWGLVPLEAMSVGRPVIATGTGGSGEYLVDGENCLLFDPGDAQALAGAVRRLAADPGLRERLIAGGRATAARYSEAAFAAGVVAAVEAARAR